MDARRSVLENATVLVAGRRIEAVGNDVEIPADARVFDLAGRTVMPGIVDVHAHYLGTIAPTHVIEQRVAPPSRSPYWSGRRRRTCVREHSAMFERPGVSPENRCNVR